jgi:RND family efflux transporter MFP subunit
VNSSTNPIFWVIAIALVTIGSGCSSPEPEAKAGGVPPIPVKLQTLTLANLEDSSEFVGNLEAKEKVIVKPEIQGQIQEIRVSSGDRVNRGETLVLLKPDQTTPQLDSAKETVNVAIADRDAAIEQLKIAQSQQASVQEEVDLAQVNFQRAKFLLEQGAIGRFDYDRAQTDLEIKKNRLKEAKDAVQAAQTGIQQAEAKIRQAKSQVATAAVNVGFKQVSAPISGTIGDLPVKQGDYATMGEAIATITRNDSLDLRISVPVSRAGQLRQGMTVELIAPGTGKTLERGRVSFISPNIDTSLQTVLIKASFPNARGKLRDGQKVEAKIVWNNEPGILIPTTAISRVGSKSFVFVVEQQTADGKPQQVVRQRPIELGNIQDASYQVLEGLEVGDSIAVSNILKLRDGATIKSES